VATPWSTSASRTFFDIPEGWLSAQVAESVAKSSNLGPQREKFPGRCT
jgi:hypothetical protein